MYRQNVYVVTVDFNVIQIPSALRLQAAHHFHDVMGDLDPNFMCSLYDARDPSVVKLFFLTAAAARYFEGVLDRAEPFEEWIDNEQK